MFFFNLSLFFPFFCECKAKEYWNVLKEVDEIDMKIHTENVKVQVIYTRCLNQRRVLLLLLIYFCSVNKQTN